MNIVWSPRAIECADEISSFIALDKPSAAAQWIDDVLHTVNLLAFSPEIGRVISELGIDSVRELIFGNYRIIYRIIAEDILVIAIRNFKQLLPTDILDT